MDDARIPPPNTKDVSQLRLLSIFHYVFGGLLIASCVVMMMQDDFSLVAFKMLTVALLLVIAVGTLIAGRFLAQRWNARFCQIIAGIICLVIPFGTVLGIATLAVLERPGVKGLFGERDEKTYPLPPPSTDDINQLTRLSSYHTVYGGLAVLVVLLSFLVLFSAIGILHVGFADLGKEPVTTVSLCSLLLNVILAVCAPLSARFLAQHRNARFSRIIAVLLCLAFPLGTVLGIATLAVLARPGVKGWYASANRTPPTTRDAEQLALLSIWHYGYGGLAALLSLIPLSALVARWAMWAMRDGFEVWLTHPYTPQDVYFLLLFAVFAVCVPLSGYFLVKRRHRRFSQVIAVTLSLCIPFGTVLSVFPRIVSPFIPFGIVLGIFTLVVLARPSVQALYGEGG